MAVSPGIYNITLQRRADYYVTLQFKDSTGTAIDLTGWTVEAQSWDENRNKNTWTLRLRIQTEQQALFQFR